VAGSHGCAPQIQIGGRARIQSKTVQGRGEVRVHPRPLPRRAIWHNRSRQKRGGVWAGQGTWEQGFVNGGYPPACPGCHYSPPPSPESERTTINDAQRMGGGPRRSRRRRAEGHCGRGPVPPPPLRRAPGRAPSWAPRGRCRTLRPGRGPSDIPPPRHTHTRSGENLQFLHESEKGVL